MSRDTRALAYPARADMTSSEQVRLDTGYDVRPNGCWEWSGAAGSRGYCQVAVAGVRVQAHRLFYILRYGPVPANYDIDHLCRNTRCVNAEHLEAVPHRVNIQRGFDHRRAKAESAA